jgi:protein-disulfide isomerase
MATRDRRRREKKRRPTGLPVDAKSEPSQRFRPARERREKRRPTRRSRRVRNLGIAAGTAAAAVVVVILIVLSQTVWKNEGGGTATEFIVPTPRPTAIPRQGTTLGNPDAPLTIVEYSDFKCPYCKTAALETVPQIEEEYIATGKVKLVFRHFVIHGKEAEMAAEAAECASEQNAFWEYHDVLFLNNERVTFNSENLKRFAQGLGLDTESFGTCLDSKRYIDKLEDDAAEARRRGVSSTPTFFVGQTKLEGAKSYAEFKKAIDDELAKLGGTPEAE